MSGAQRTMSPRVASVIGGRLAGGTYTSAIVSLQAMAGASGGRLASSVASGAPPSSGLASGEPASGPGPASGTPPAPPEPPDPPVPAPPTPPDDAIVTAPLEQAPIARATTAA